MGTLFSLWQNIIMKQKTWHRNVALCFSFIAAMFSPLNALGHPQAQYWQNRTASQAGFSINPKFTYYSTKENYDLDSTSYPVTGLSSATYMNFDLNLTYGPSEDLFFFGRLSAIRAALDLTTPLDQNAFGFSDQLVGTAFRLFKFDSGGNVSMQAELTIPTYSNTTSFTNVEPWKGDQSYDFTGGAFAEIPFPSSLEWYFEGGAGFTWRSNGYSAAVPWSLIVKHESIGDGFLFGWGLQGQLSLKTDNSLIASAKNDSNRGAAGSFYINSVNPSWIETRGYLGYQFQDLQIKAEGGFTLTGAYAPKGFWTAVGLTYSFGSDSSNAQADSRAEAMQPTTSPRRKIIRDTHPFTAYSLEATVTSSNDKLYILKINKGADDGVEVGQQFDIFKTENPNSVDARQIRIARAKITNTKDHEAVLSVLEYFQEVWIDVGFIARRLP